MRNRNGLIQMSRIKMFLLMAWFLMTGINAMAHVSFHNDADGHYMIDLELIPNQKGATLYVSFQNQTGDEIPLEAQLLLKLSDGTTLTLKGSCFRIEDRGQELQIAGSTIKPILKISDAKFELTEEQVAAFQFGIKDFLLNTQVRPTTCHWNKDKIGVKLFEEFQKARNNDFETYF